MTIPYGGRRGDGACESHAFRANQGDKICNGRTDVTLNDIRGEPTSATNQAALDIFEEAVTQFLGFTGDPVATVQGALEEDPGFVLAHCLYAHLMVTATEKALLPTVKETLDTLAGLADSANERERGHIAAIQAWHDGELAKAADILAQVLLDHPRDAMALQIAHLTDFFLGHSQTLRDRIARVLPRWSEDTPGYGFVLGMHAFGLEECADYAAAEEAGRRAVEINANDAWAIHAVAHVMEMQGRLGDGVDWLTTRRAEWEAADILSVHNAWHLALFHLDLGHDEEVLRLYDGPVRGERSDLVIDKLDASAMLWRLHLFGVDVGARWEELAGAWAPMAEDAHYAFNDMHAMMAFAATGRDKEADAQLRALEARAGHGDGGGGGDNVMMTRQIGLPVCRGLLAFGRGNYGEAVEHILPARTIAQRFGGSHAQRDIIGLTLIEAALRAENFTLARALAAERTALKPTSPRNWRFAARAHEGLGDKAEAGAARAEAANLAH